MEVVYAIEGSPLIIVPCGIFESAPNPNAARLFQSFFFSVEAQQLLADDYAHRSFHAQVKEKPGRTPMSTLKLLKSDPPRCSGRAKRSRRAIPRFSGCDRHRCDAATVSM